jgi:uncharacterized protein (TIGR02996 family)
MSEELALCRAIIDAPEEDVARLVLADWLEEHGQPQRAEFIRLQLQLAKTPTDDPRCAEWLRREHDLLTYVISPGQRDLHHPDVTYEYERGLVEAITCSIGAFLTHSRGWFERHPIRRLNLQPYAEFVGLLGECLRRVEMARLHTFRISPLPPWYPQIGADGASAIANCPHFGRLLHLDLRLNQIGNPGVAALATSPHLERLESLRLSHCFFDDGGAEALIRSPYLRHLRQLEVSGNGISLSMIQALQRRFGMWVHA